MSNSTLFLMKKISYFALNPLNDEETSTIALSSAYCCI